MDTEGYRHISSLSPLQSLSQLGMRKLVCRPLLHSQGFIVTRLLFDPGRESRASWAHKSALATGCVSVGDIFLEIKHILKFLWWFWCCYIQLPQLGLEFRVQLPQAAQRKPRRCWTPTHHWALCYWHWILAFSCLDSFLLSSPLL